MNAPDADDNTPTENNNNYVGTITTFHGSCPGGPGHCDLPLTKSRRADQRRIHHNEPRNFRLDATTAVQRLLNQGEDNLSLQMVIVQPDGRPSDDAIFMDGVSLVFLD